ncbi:hypothetical protein H4R21_001626 [Coemansia helicoidea]|uniref:Uncharacterized protein n=1 Tax=Coemansia helicoidea TaxID=1286919 RepID=A0ACC1LBB4_9FUNG|nr:hypothetical protein H4R21_001626 [Coemansia helicoidea]
MRQKTEAADDLQDDFDLDDSFAAPSDSDGGDGGDSEAPDAAGGTAKKRALRGDDAPAAAEEKKKKRRKKSSQREPAVPGAFAVPRDVDAQAKLWNEYMLKAHPGMTRLELGDVGVQRQHVYAVDSEPAAGPEFLVDLARTAVSTGKAKGKVAFGAPQVLVICSSALRVVDLVRRLRTVSRRPVAKLFSRHIKIDAQKQALRGMAIDVAVGTPNRIRRLLADGDLKLNRLRLVVIDCWQDSKMRVVLDMDDTRDDLFAIWSEVLRPASANPDYMFKLRLA